jgi:3-hydroxyisobutyrate dehydrogenase
MPGRQHNTEPGGKRMTIAFIGLGNMGAPMALNLIKVGHALVVCDLDEARATAHREAGAGFAASPREAATGADVIITSLPGPPQIEAVARGPEGLLAGLGAGATWIDATTTERTMTLALAAEVERLGGVLLDAPVTGAVDGARRGQLTLFVGGATERVEAQRTMLEAMGRVIHCGPLGTGLVVKLVTNMLWFIHAAALGEGLVLGVKGGVELGTLWEAIKSSVGDSFVARHDAPSIFAGHYDPSFSLDLCLKDLGLIADLADGLGVPVELAELARALFDIAKTRYGGTEGELQVVRRLEDDTGTSLRLEGDWPPPWEQ